eukprot:TRINITY_DN5732_c0_g1_i4.p1 TRINITY_DN5732_c0_g1~~TRINITY_DN5732_c0_g1_i4.p1  ORF type:complete len:183 (-),score=28.53 TRINITY_DN5732_c0_g1_i4:5-553(-)
MLESDYNKQVEEAATAASSHESADVFRRFGVGVLPTCRGPRLSQTQLDSLMKLQESRGTDAATLHSSADTESSFLAKRPRLENSFGCLFTSGFLGQDVRGELMFQIPLIGSFVEAVTQGRHEVVQRLRKTRFHEILQSQLMKTGPLRRSHLGTKYILRDLIGSETVVVTQSPAGPLLRLSPL